MFILPILVMRSGSEASSSELSRRIRPWLHFNVLSLEIGRPPENAQGMEAPLVWVRVVDCTGKESIDSDYLVVLNSFLESRAKETVAHCVPLKATLDRSPPISGVSLSPPGSV